MTRTTLRHTLATLGWTIRGLARMLARPEHSVTNWRKPGYSVPDDVAAWLERRLEAHHEMMRADPPPPGACP